MTYFNTCPNCGAHNDPGEKCSCRDQRTPDLLPDKLEKVKSHGNGKKTQLVQTYKFNF